MPSSFKSSFCNLFICVLILSGGFLSAAGSGGGFVKFLQGFGRATNNASDSCSIESTETFFSFLKSGEDTCFSELKVLLQNVVYYQEPVESMEKYLKALYPAISGGASGVFSIHLIFPMMRESTAIWKDYAHEKWVANQIFSIQQSDSPNKFVDIFNLLRVRAGIIWCCTDTKYHNTANGSFSTIELCRALSDLFPTNLEKDSSLLPDQYEWLNDIFCDLLELFKGKTITKESSDYKILSAICKLLSNAHGRLASNTTKPGTRNYLLGVRNVKKWGSKVTSLLSPFDYLTSLPVVSDLKKGLTEGNSEHEPVMSEGSFKVALLAALVGGGVAGYKLVKFSWQKLMVLVGKPVYPVGVSCLDDSGKDGVSDVCLHTDSANGRVAQSLSAVIDYAISRDMSFPAVTFVGSEDAVVPMLRALNSNLTLGLRVFQVDLRDKLMFVEGCETKLRAIFDFCFSRKSMVVFRMPIEIPYNVASILTNILQSKPKGFSGVLLFDCTSERHAEMLKTNYPLNHTLPVYLSKITPAEDIQYLSDIIGDDASSRPEWTSLFYTDKSYPVIANGSELDKVRSFVHLDRLVKGEIASLLERMDKEESLEIRTHVFYLFNYLQSLPLGLSLPENLKLPEYLIKKEEQVVAEVIIDEPSSEELAENMVEVSGLSEEGLVGKDDSVLSVDSDDI